MTEEQFEALRDWIDTRAALKQLIRQNANDQPFVRARERELDEADDWAKSVLVEGYVYGGRSS